MKNINYQMNLYNNGDIAGLRKFWYASDSIKDYDFETATKSIYEFISTIINSSIINKDRDVLEYRLVKQELLGYPSILLFISNADTFDINYVIKLDVIHRNKDKYYFEDYKTKLKVGFNEIEKLTEYINKKDSN